MKHIETTQPFCRFYRVRKQRVDGH